MRKENIALHHCQVPTTHYPPIFISDEETGETWITRGLSHGNGLLSCWLPGVVLADLTRLTVADGGGCICLYQPPTLSAGVTHWDPGQSVSNQDRPGEGNATQRTFCLYLLTFTSSPPGYHNSRKKVLIWPFFKVILINFYADENKSGKFAFQYFYPIGILWGLDFLGSLDEINSGTNYYRIETKYQL